MAIGPELPPRLQKRKRDSEDPEDSQNTPSSLEKRNRTGGSVIPSPSTEQQPELGNNPDEIYLNSSDEEDETGPQPAPKPAQPTSRSIGPSLPPAQAHSSGNNSDEINLNSSEEDDDDDDVGPSIPPSTASKPQVRVIGPSMPPSSSADAADDGANSSSDDDNIGPAPLPAGASTSASTASIFDTMDPSASEAESTKPQREAWMLAPPDGADWASKVDPTKLRNRRFASGPRAGGARGSGGGMGAEWTETPEEKRKRLANAVMGVSEGEGRASNIRTGAAGTAVDSHRRTAEDEETDRRIREYNERNRGESLVQQHRQRHDREEEDDPSKRAFDREKDIGGGMRISHAQKKEMMNRAADFGSKFAKGSYL